MKETKFYKWLDNFWYHYKWIFLVVLVFTVFIIVSIIQMLGREDVDMYIMYAGPEVITVQNATYIQKAFENLTPDDLTGDGKVTVSLRDLAILSKEEMEERNKAMEDAEGAVDGVANAIVVSHMSQNLQTFNQEILGGDSVICLLSPYTYSIVREADGFMPISELLGYTPDGLYDECGIYLCETDFGRFSEGLYTLPEDTILCIRRLSSMAFLKGSNKTEREHNYCVEKFKAAIEWKKPAVGA